MRTRQESTAECILDGTRYRPFYPMGTPDDYASPEVLSFIERHARVRGAGIALAGYVDTVVSSALCLGFALREAP